MRALSRIVGGLALAAALIVVPGAVSAQQADAALSAWIDQLGRCASARPLRVGVAGFEASQQVFSRAQADAVRVEAERRLVATGRVRLSALGDRARLIALSQDAAENRQAIRQLLESTQDVDLVVFFGVPERGANETVRLSLVAWTRDGTCGAPSPPIELPRPQAIDTADLGRFLEGFAERVLAAERTSEVRVCPAQAEGGRVHACGAVLSGALTRAFVAARNAPRFALSGRNLTVRAAGDGACEPSPGVVTIRGTYDISAARTLRVDLSALGGEGGVVGFDQAAVTDHGCDLTVPTRTLTAFVLESQGPRFDRERLAVRPGRADNQVGDMVDLRIQLGRPMFLYCWMISEDGTAAPLFPAGASARDGRAWPAGALRYPASFRLGDVEYAAAAANVFGCFGTPRAVAGDLAAAWAGLWPQGADAPRALTATETQRLLEAFRALPEVSEAHAELRIRPRR